MQSDIEDPLNQIFVSNPRALALKISTMIYTAAQITAFIKNPAQMGVSASTRKYLADNEGLMFVQDLIDFVETETWNQITDNMCRPPMIPDPDNADHMIRQAAFLLYANSLGRLRIAAVAV